ncbi:hypothetical protein [Micromonospora sp. NPDC005172]|uniref:hypothetical protein n=1 Tax=Micromonospora sp. NPDC005172 TaxID=3156867 RepID=UPI00339E4915
MSSNASQILIAARVTVPTPPAPRGYAGGVQEELQAALVDLNAQDGRVAPGLRASRYDWTTERDVDEVIDARWPPRPGGDEPGSPGVSKERVCEGRRRTGAP